MGSISASSFNDLPPAQIADAFAQAIAQARLFEGATAPNPPVGCVALDAHGEILAVAAHQKAGTPHAEALAIAACRQAGTVSRIHTLVVTLEPCNHHGRTPPCSEAILSTPATAVWIACPDPNPRVAGGGAARLSQAGLQVRLLADLPSPRTEVLQADAERLLAPFSTLMRTGLPFVTLKQAISETGTMVPPPGRKTFTSHKSLTLAHDLRRRADAILTGSGTILADDPAFTVRLVPDHPQKRRPLVILDRRRRVPQTYLAAAQARGFEPLLADDLAEALAALGDHGVLEVLVEAGPSLVAAILDGPYWDEHVLIEQGLGADGCDRVTIRRRKDADIHPPREDSHVFRYR